MDIVELGQFAQFGSAVKPKYTLEVNGVAIKFRLVVHQDIEGRVTDGVLRWVVAFGPPFGFVVTSEQGHNDNISEEQYEKRLFLWGF